MSRLTCQRTVRPRRCPRHLRKLDPDVMVTKPAVPRTIRQIAVGVGQHRRKLGGELTEVTSQWSISPSRCSPGSRGRRFLGHLSRQRGRTGERQGPGWSEPLALRPEITVVVRPGVGPEEWRPLPVRLSRGKAKVVVTVFLQRKRAWRERR